MNAKSIFLVVLSCFSLLCSINAQSMDEAFVQAKKEKKIVMVAVESASCKECNDVAAKGIMQFWHNPTVLDLQKRHN